MKVGILTFHEVFNPGAFFQALGTQTLLESLGHEAWVIDYTSPEHRYSTRQLLLRKPHRLPFRLKRIVEGYRKNRAFAEDRARLMHLTRYFESRRDLSQEHFDAVLVGADIVWNYQMPKLGRDPVYFGAGVNTDRLIAFAPSVGQCNLDEPIPDFVRQGLPAFHRLSARDSSTQELVRKVTGTVPPLICDPAFHLAPDSLVDEAQTGDYLLVYMMSQYCTPELANAVRDFARKHKLRIVATLYRNAWADENRITHGPLEWLRLFKGARYVVTNTFHGSVFSTMMGKRFAVQFTPAILNKTQGMLEELGLSSRVVEEPSRLEEIVTRPWDQEGAHSKINEWKQYAQGYLREALEAQPTPLPA